MLFFGTSPCAHPQKTHTPLAAADSLCCLSPFYCTCAVCCAAPQISGANFYLALSPCARCNYRVPLNSIKGALSPGCLHARRTGVDPVEFASWMRAAGVLDGEGKFDVEKSRWRSVLKLAANAIEGFEKTRVFVRLMFLWCLLCWYFSLNTQSGLFLMVFRNYTNFHLNRELIGQQTSYQLEFSPLYTNLKLWAHNDNEIDYCPSISLIHSEKSNFI